MIRTINTCVNAAHPELPLIEATTFVGSPSAVFVRGVPKSVGLWQITAVAVAATYPDNSTQTVAAVESADGVWVATLPATATSGRTASGLRILADGVDENGAAVAGYVLGLADFAVHSLLPVPAPGETFYMLRLFDAAPSVAKKGDVATIGGVLKYYNGTTWLPFADLSNYYTAAETDEAIERVAAYYITYNAQGAAFPTAAALLNATTVYSGGVVRTPTRNDYAVVLADETHDNAEWRYIYAIPDGSTTGQWEAQYPIETNDYTALSNKPQINGHVLTNNQTGASLGLLDLSGGTMSGTLGVHYVDSSNFGDDSFRFKRFDDAENSVYDVMRRMDLPYTIHAAAVSSGTTPTVTNILARATNTATLGSSVTAATVTLPAATAGKMRDFYISLTVEGSTAPSLYWIDPATNTDADIAVGEDSLANIDTGLNIVLFSEAAGQNRWIVSVKHEEAAS